MPLRLGGGQRGPGVLSERWGIRAGRRSGPIVLPESLWAGMRIKGGPRCLWGIGYKMHPFSLPGREASGEAGGGQGDAW